MQELVVLGTGNLGLLFGCAALETSTRVMPIRHGDDIKGRIEATGPNTPILVAVGEKQLAEVARQIPNERRGDAILIQNEIFPHHIDKLGLTEPTVATIWSAKKKDIELMRGSPTRVFGKHAAALKSWHDVLEIDCQILESEDELRRAIVSKYSFILTINALGLRENRKLGDWLMNDADVDLVRDIAKDAYQIGQALLGSKVDQNEVLRDVFEGMNTLTELPSRGRTAEMRVRTAMDDAARFELEISALGSL